MKFQLELQFNSPQKISIREKIMLCGSCFAEEIGEKFQQHKFHSLINPSGILFNPYSIAESLSIILEKKVFSEIDLVEQNGLFHSLHHHSSFSSENKEECLQKINSSFSEAHNFLKETNWFIITFGSAFAWKHKNSNAIVANCHKMPATQFEKILLKSEEIISVWKKLISELKKFNPGLKIIFTVSPVRYLRDGLMENNRSKAQLLSAVHELCEEGHGVYFPAYELVNDVLRDYRFFKEDMVHPNEQAVNFVWGKFAEWMLDEFSQKALKEIQSFNQLQQHRPLKSSATKEHLEKIKEARSVLSLKYPFLRQY